MMQAEPSSRFQKIPRTIISAVATLVVLSAAGALASSTETRVLEVIATAYNSLPGQGQGDPTVTAWGVKLRPGMKVIAVSRDLIDLGLTNGVEVRIDGLPGTYTVLDKTAKRWKKRIDIYMGIDKSAAMEWGKRTVTIRW